MPRPRKRSFSIKGHRTSVSLEEPFWDALRDVAVANQLPLAKLVEEIDADRGNTGLSTALRIYLLDYYKTRQHLPDSNNNPDQASSADAPTGINRKTDDEP